MSTRRGVGLSAFENRTSLSSKYATHGANLRSSHEDSLQTQLSVVQASLHNFAIQHGDRIKTDPSIRADFARMCNAMGVDPLAGSNAKGKGSTTEKGISGWLSNRGIGAVVSDFYFQVAVRVVEVCRSSRGENGGLISIEECRTRVGRGRGLGGEIAVSDDDILRAVKSLAPLGPGFSVITVGNSQMIRSVPKQLNIDQSTVLDVIQVLGYVTCSMLEDNLGWEYVRAETVINDLLGDSLVWVDAQAAEREYWSPAFMNDLDD